MQFELGSWKYGAQCWESVLASNAAFLKGSFHHAYGSHSWLEGRLGA